MIRVSICDDEPGMLNNMYEIIHKTFCENNFDCELMCFNSGAEMLAVHRECKFDVIFLDILMPDHNGFDIAKEVRMISDKTLLLFVTSQDELVYDSFNYHPFYFLRKGDAETFANSLAEQVKKIAYFIKRNRMISLEINSGESRLVCLQDIVFIVSNRNMIDYHLTTGEYIPIREKMNIAEEKLNMCGFVRIHKQYIVNISKIHKLNMSKCAEVILSTDKTLPVGRKYKDSLLLKYKEYLRIIT